ncbi:MAG: hypothetical protein D6713_07955, partial [Deltaproteobacteria bacterium]
MKNWEILVKKQRVIYISAFLIWTLVCLFAGYSIISEEVESKRFLLEETGRTIASSVTHAMEFTARAGGVFVEVREGTGRDESFQGAGRDVETKDGRLLTKFDPPFLLSRITDFAAEKDDTVRVRIIGKAGLTPETTPSPEER